MILVDVWMIYSKSFYDKKLENKTKESLENYAKEKHNMNLSILSDHYFTIMCDVTGNKIIYQGKEIREFPKIVFFKKYDLYLARQFELLGVKVFNSSDAMSDARNKLKTYQILSQNGINIPKSIYISSGVKRRNYTYNEVCQYLGTDKFVLKPVFGSKGKDIYLIKTEKEFNDILNDFSGICIFQEFIDTTNGKDIRSFVIADKYQGSAYRTNPDDFRQNYSLGAKVYRLQEKDENIINVAEAAARALNLWSCTVDLLINENGYYVCEVNSIPGKTRKINTNKRLINRLSEELENLK